jgi:hypothetical protein
MATVRIRACASARSRCGRSGSTRPRRTGAPSEGSWGTRVHARYTLCNYGVDLFCGSRCPALIVFMAPGPDTSPDHMSNIFRPQPETVRGRCWGQLVLFARGVDLIGLSPVLPVSVGLDVTVKHRERDSGNKRQMTCRRDNRSTVHVTLQKPTRPRVCPPSTDSGAPGLRPGPAAVLDPNPQAEGPGLHQIGSSWQVTPHRGPQRGPGRTATPARLPGCLGPTRSSWWQPGDRSLRVAMPEPESSETSDD